MTYPPTISKSDQRFALALSLLIVQGFFGAIAILGGATPAGDIAFKISLSFSGLTGAAVGWYFKSRDAS